MIVPMKKVLLVALREEQEALAAALQRCGEVMPVPPEDSPPGMEADSGGALRAEQALKVIRKYQGKQKMFAPRQEVAEQQLFSPTEEGLELLERVETLQKELESVRAGRESLKSRMEELRPWIPMGISVESLGGTRYAGIHSGYVDRSRTEEIRQAAESLGGTAEILDNGPQGTAVLVYTYREEEQEILQTLSGLGFSEARPPAEKGLPKDLFAETQAREQEMEARETAITENLTELAEQKHQLELLYDQTQAEEERENTPFAQTTQTVFLEGWVRSDRTERLKKALDKASDCYYLELSDPAEGENPPTVTKNNQFISQFETITDMFSRPHNGELDPNPVMAPWYWIIFGLMMGDAGYGLMMLVGIWAFKRLAKPRGDFAKLVNVLFFSSITTIFWGIVFGSYFGATWHPLLFAPLDNPMGMLIFCLIIGVLHIFSGMAIKMAADIKAGHFWDAIFDQLSWMLLLTGLGLLFLPQTKTVGMVLALAGAAIVLLTAGRAKKGVIGKIIGGFGGLYGITGYMSDILSYSRILALSLATGVVGMVMNLLAGMVQGSVIGFICSLLIYAVGHIFNLAMGLLSAYVHDSRLQYIEFFNKFYEGGGYAFRPLKMNPRFVEINDSRKN